MILTIFRRLCNYKVGPCTGLLKKMAGTQYLVIVEKGASSYGAYVPDLPGCVAVGETKAEVHRLITEAVQLHIEGWRKDGVVVPLPSSTAELIDVVTD